MSETRHRNLLRYSRLMSSSGTRRHERGPLCRANDGPGWCPPCVSAESSLCVDHVEQHMDRGDFPYCFLVAMTVMTILFGSVALALAPWH